MLIALGLFFRVYHLSHKVYWDDEVYTSLHVLGITEAEVVHDAPVMLDARNLRAIIHPIAVPMRPLAATITSLATEDAQHPPGYYVLAHLWVSAFGNSVTSIRMLSALFGIVALPCMYWLCWELFGSSRASWLGVALLAVSPVSVLFSQEAREYALWSIAILVTSALFLRALRLGSGRHWGSYAVALAAAFYIFPLTVVCALANLVVVIIRNGRRRLSRLMMPVCAHLAALVLCIPWLVVIVAHIRQIRRTMGAAEIEDRSPMVVAHALLRLIRLDFIDTVSVDRLATDAIGGALIVALIGWALALSYRERNQLYRERNQHPWLFISMLVAVSTLPLAFIDIVFGTTTTSDVRYFIPFYLGVDLALVSAFVILFVERPDLRRSQSIWAAAMSAVVLARVISCAASSQSETWWNKYNEASIAVAHAIDRSADPVLVSNQRLEGSLSLGGYLDASVVVRLHPQCYLCASSAASAPIEFTMLRHLRPDATVFFLRPSARLQRFLRERIPAAAQRYFGADELTGVVWPLNTGSSRR